MLIRFYNITSTDREVSEEELVLISDKALGQSSQSIIDSLLESGDMLSYHGIQLDSSSYEIITTHSDLESLQKFENALQPAADAVQQKFDVNIIIQPKILDSE